MKIYISGPITNRPKMNAESFEAAEVFLLGKGYEVVNPLKIHPEHRGMCWTDYMKADLKALLDCDAIYLLHDWETSRGARIECYVARAMMITEIHQEPKNPSQ